MLEKNTLFIQKAPLEGLLLVKINCFRNKVSLKFGFRQGAKKSMQFGPIVPELWLFSVKQQNKRDDICAWECNFFCQECQYFL